MAEESDQPTGCLDTTLAKHAVDLQEFIEAAAISWADMKRIPKEIMDLINENLLNIEKYQECLVDSELSAKDVLLDLIRLSMQNYLFLDQVQDLLQCVIATDRNELKSNEYGTDQLKELIDTLNHHITTALQKFSQVEEKYQQSQQPYKTLAKTCTVEAEKASNSRFKGRLKAVALVSVISIVGIFVIPACLPAAVAGGTLVTVAGTAVTTATGIKVGAAATAMVTAGGFIHCDIKYSRVIESFEAIRQGLDKVECYGTKMYTGSLGIKTQLKAIQDAVNTIERHVKKNHSKRAINRSVDVLFNKLDGLRGQVQPVSIEEAACPVKKIKDD